MTDSPNSFAGNMGGQAVEVRVASGGLLVETGGLQNVWHYGDLRLTHFEPARFVYQQQVLEVADSRIFAHIERANAEAFQKLRGDVTAQPWNWVWISIGAIVLALWVTWVYLIPAVAAGLASRVPVSWEERLGRSVQSGFLGETGECTAPQATRAMEEIVARLDRAKPSAYRFRVKISKSDEMNAFAAPGGHVVVLKGLMEKADSPEQVAGVLAHEMEHVRQRHVTRGMFRQMTLSVLASLIFGDAGSMGSVVRGLGSLKFQREDEASADREGMRNLAAAGVDPQAMISFFRKLQKQEGDMPKMAEYLSSHPDTEARIDELQKLAAELDVRPRALQADANWAQTRMACR